MAAEKMTEQQISEALEEVNAPLEANQQWLREGDKLTKSFVFKNFIDAFGWMTQVAIHAEKLIHHPEWFNVWNRVDVCLTTHDAGGISELDFKMIKRMENLYRR